MTDISTATRGVSPPTSELDKLLEDRANAEAINDIIAEHYGAALAKRKDS